MPDILYHLIDHAGIVWQFYDKAGCEFFALQYFGSIQPGQCMPAVLI